MEWTPPSRAARWAAVTIRSDVHDRGGRGIEGEVAQLLLTGEAARRDEAGRGRAVALAHRRHVAREGIAHGLARLCPCRRCQDESQEHRHPHPTYEQGPLRPYRFLQICPPRRERALVDGPCRSGQGPERPWPIEVD